MWAKHITLFIYIKLFTFLASFPCYFSIILHTSGSSTSLNFRITWEALGNSSPKAVFQKPINIYFLGVKTKHHYFLKL